MNPSLHTGDTGRHPSLKDLARVSLTCFCLLMKGSSQACGTIFYVYVLCGRKSRRITSLQRAMLVRRRGPCLCLCLCLGCEWEIEEAREVLLSFFAPCYCAVLCYLCARMFLYSSRFSLKIQMNHAAKNKERNVEECNGDRPKRGASLSHFHDKVSCSVF